MERFSVQTAEHQWREVRKMYESPIEIFQGEMQTEYENGILRVLQKYDIHCNKEELTKALAYDRDQYRKGYEDAKPRWIPCSERLPEINSDVLATLKWGDITYAWRFDDDYWCICEGDSTSTTSEILAWMPLPDPYKRDEEWKE